MRTKIYPFIVLLLAMNSLYSQGELKGTITNSITKEPIPFANVILKINDQNVKGVQANIDGNYHIFGINPGAYTVQVSCLGYKTYKTTIQIINDDIKLFDIELSDKGTELIVHEVNAQSIMNTERPIIGEIILTKNPGTEIGDILATSPKILVRDGDVWNIGGSRTPPTVIIDEVKMRDLATINRHGIGFIEVYDNGIPAMYGDATGGLISITTKNIAPVFFGGVEARTSQFLDQYGHYYLSGTIGGPIIRSKKLGIPVVGFLISAEAFYDKDNDPGAGGWWKGTSDALSRILANPTQPGLNGNNSLIFNANFLTKNDFEKTPFRLNSESMSLNANYKLNFALGKNSLLTIGGFINMNQGRRFDYNNSLFNSENNGQDQSTIWDLMAKYVQFFPNDSGKLIKNVQLTFQADYLKNYSQNEDIRHGKKLFHYGYVGRFDITKIRTYEYGYDEHLDMNGYRFRGLQDVATSFTPSEINSNIASYTSQYYQYFENVNPNFVSSINSLQQGGAIVNGNLPDPIYGLYNNPGTPFNGYGYTDANQFRFLMSGAATIKNHKIRLGFEFEQRNDALYNVNPVGLWNIARLSTNSHLATINDTSGVAIYNTQNTYTDTIEYDPLPGVNKYFDRNLRELLGLSINGTDYINVDALDPNQLNINMFSADELYNSGSMLVNNYGYDVYGNRSYQNYSLLEFFTQKENGEFTRPISAFQPIYIAGYIQDQFTFKDMKFNVGVRIDRYDANQEVLKDKYSLYETRKAGDVTSFGSVPVTHPGNVQNDWVVYVDDKDAPTKIVGYRSGDTWYNADGIETNDPTQIRNSSGGVQPYLVSSTHTVNNPGSGLYNAFKDYDPQINVMPRIAFSFPLGENTIFTAHYDVIVQRPQNSLVRSNPLDYLFWDNGSYNSGGRYFNSANLRPERITDYSLALKQRIIDGHEIKLSITYRELRDMIASVRVFEAYPRTYNTWANMDFGTVKGLTLEYYMNTLKGNVNAQASYTLQFADGTGSSNTSSVSLVNAGIGNLRTTIPLSYDTRHQFKLFGAFTFGDSKLGQDNYLGPKGKFGEAIFRNLGISMTLYGNTGLPYSKKSIPGSTASIGGGNAIGLLGSINGARLPFELYNDLLVDKTITIGKKKNATLNIYFQILNFLDLRNIVSVYEYTGSPTEDGWLSSNLAATTIANQLDPDAYRNYYQMKVADPTNFSKPIRIRFGAMVNF